MNKEEENRLSLNSIRIRNKVVELIKKKYIDFPKLLHEKNGNGTSSDLVIDEIAWYVLRNYVKVYFPIDVISIQKLESYIGKGLEKGELYAPDHVRTQEQQGRLNALFELKKQLGL